MDDKTIVDKMLKGTIKPVTSKERDPKSHVICKGIIDDYLGARAQQNVYYLKWLYLAHKHKDGLIVLEGKFKRAQGFITYASQFDETYMPINLLIDPGTVIYSEETVSFVPTQIYEALVYSPTNRRSKRIVYSPETQKERLLDYAGWDATWELTEKELAGIDFWKEFL